MPLTYLVAIWSFMVDIVAVQPDLKCGVVALHIRREGAVIETVGLVMVLFVVVVAAVVDVAVAAVAVVPVTAVAAVQCVVAAASDSVAAAVSVVVAVVIINNISMFATAVGLTITSAVFFLFVCPSVLVHSLNPLDH